MKYVAYKLNTYKLADKKRGFYAVDEYGDFANPETAWVATDEMARLLVNDEAVLVEPKFKEKNYWPKVWLQNTLRGYIKNAFFAQFGPNDIVQYVMLSHIGWEPSRINGQICDYKDSLKSTLYTAELQSEARGKEILDSIKGKKLDL